MEEQLEINRMRAEMEAILFASGEPVQIKRISEILLTDDATVFKLADILNDRYEEMQSALQVLRLGDRLQICTRSEYAGAIKQALDIRRNVPLSPAAMEVLAIIAYNQPVSKSFVEQVRGVDSSRIVNNLIEKGLIEEAGRLELPGKPLSYRTTANFLRCFGLSGLDDLPKLPEDSEEETPSEDESETQTQAAEEPVKEQEAGTDEPGNPESLTD
ncbi:SMC-Scp complex subunit ScpB [Candidatus Soleaferrea massiliensis]|uniref:SMC-Scp complex subunit ScpB n=1 Tax=Candidatus Soleaferrea massiliensis TaxID=1470354 RepID=UPI000B169E1B|nr:SMC-Scp complex subunit ScpB [Candidatus Soleaferrea massiliensis]